MKVRFTTDQFQDEMIQAAAWNQFLKLLHIADILESEQIIEPATAEILRGIAFDFKSALVAIQELIEQRDEQSGEINDDFDWEEIASRAHYTYWSSTTPEIIVNKFDRLSDNAKSIWIKVVTEVVELYKNKTNRNGEL